MAEQYDSRFCSVPHAINPLLSIRFLSRYSIKLISPASLISTSRFTALEANLPACSGVEHSVLIKDFTRFSVIGLF